MKNVLRNYGERQRLNVLILFKAMFCFTGGCYLHKIRSGTYTSALYKAILKPRIQPIIKAQVLGPSNDNRYTWRLITG